MTLIESFQDEHVLIDQVLGSLRTYVEELVGGTAEPDDGRRFVAFFSEFAGHFHHEREEGVFFHALVTQADLPDTSGPVHALLREHAEMGEWLRDMTPLLERAPRSEEEAGRLRALAIRYSHALWRHIDAENSVLYPEGEERLGRCGVRELPDRAMTVGEAAARQQGVRLQQRYPPLADATLTRGDGCFMCRAHGDTCDGLEAEWWTDLEWKEFFMR